MGRFRKKPVEIAAIQWQGGDYSCLEDFCGLNFGRADANDVTWSPDDDGEQIVLWNSKEKQWLCCPKGHWVIRGIGGELYPCAPDIFEATHEPVEPTP